MTAHRHGPAVGADAGTGTLEQLGGCFCGAVRYRILGTLTRARSCHCSRCRKAFGGAGSAYAELTRAHVFEWLQGHEVLSVFSSQADWGLGFCSRCGSTLCGLYGGEVHGVTLGSLDDAAQVVVRAHIFVGSKAPWDHIGGNAPRYWAAPPLPMD